MGGTDVGMDKNHNSVFLVSNAVFNYYAEAPLQVWTENFLKSMIFFLREIKFDMNLTRIDRLIPLILLEILLKKDDFL